MTLKVIDLFSGIGGFSLGLERTGGFQTSQFVELDPKARQILKKHWPDVPQHDDIRTYKPTPRSADVVCGGFPCQDISEAGHGAGIGGERSGLWKEMARVIRVVRPGWVIAENVSTLRSRGLAVVLQDLNALGYDTEWHCIPASAIGAPHRRDRIWILGYPNGKQKQPVQRRSGEEGGQTTATERLLHLDDSNSDQDGNHFWVSEPPVGRVADGFPYRMDRVRLLGNSIVPQIATLIGQQILLRRG